jgi:hypothetical protein
VDIAENLGGLSRTSEIFSCQQLTIPSAQVLKEAAFQLVSRNAERLARLPAPKEES